MTARLMGMILAVAMTLAGGSVAKARPSDDASPDPARRGVGWSIVELDLDTTVLPAEERMELQGVMRLRLDALAESYGPTLLMNTRLNKAKTPVMKYRRVESDGAEVELPEALLFARVRQAHVRFDQPKPKGSEIIVKFAGASEGAASQLVIHESAALASWTTAWYPFTNPSTTDNIGFTPALLAAPGKLTLHLPAGWIGLVDGELTERRSSVNETVEVWSTPGGIARSFAAGPYKVATERVNDRVIRVYNLSENKAIGPKRLARLIADAMAAQEAKFGLFPFSSYGVVEVPSDLPAQTWSAASQQTFIVAKATNFDWDHGNIPLWGHEMAHAWWGNTVSTRGEGSKWCSESLAQLGALIAIEALEGEDAVHEFLGFSRSGYSPHQSAAGYFSLVRQGQDLPIATMGSVGASHDLADSKGTWIYHMLREELGDDLFFDVLRGVIRDYAHKEISADEMRERFIQAAPGHDLDIFFNQWLDRTGAPVLDVDWQASISGKSLFLEVTQVQDGKPFALNLEIEIQLTGGETVTKTVKITDKSNQFEIDTSARPRDLRVDPNYKLLMWRPEYGPRPGDKMASGAPIPEAVLKSVIGSYRFRGIEKDVEVFERDGALYVQPEKSPASRLLYQGGGVFHVDQPGAPIVTEFDLTKSPAESFVSKEGDQDYIADRVDQD